PLTRREVLKLAAATGCGRLCGGPPVRADNRKPERIVVGSRYRAGVLAKGPVAYWRLGEARGPVARDETMNGHDGGYFGNPVSGQAGALHNDLNSAIQVNSRDYVEIADSVAFSQPASGFGLTVEAWVRPDLLDFRGESADHYVHWLGKGGPQQQEWALRFYSRNSTRPNRISAYLFNPAGGAGAGAYFQDVLV